MTGVVFLEGEIRSVDLASCTTPGKPGWWETPVEGQVNAAAPEHFATIKTELVHPNIFKTRIDARLSVLEEHRRLLRPGVRHPAMGY